MSLIESPPDRVEDYFPQSLREKYLLAEKIEQLKLTKDATSAQIGWEPNWEEFQKLSQKRHAEGGLETTVPDGWPKHLHGPLVWQDGEFARKSSYIIEISRKEEEEIIQAMASYKELNLGLGDITKSTFYLPTLRTKLEAISTTVHDGQGFFVLRGWQPDKFSQFENALVFVGISSYIAEKRGRQNQRGMILTHITDITPLVSPESKLRSAYSNIGQPFHSDLLCGVLALFCLSPAAKGGETILASSWNVYNELAETHPDLIHTLQRDDWVHDTHGRNPPYHYRPLLHLNEDSKPILVFSRRVLTGSRETPRTPGIPPISEAQAEALDAVNFIASKNSIEIKQQAGDMLFINNLSVLHRRKSFEDSDVTKRYLMRLWLHNEAKSWTLPKTLWLPWDRIFADLPRVHDYWDHDPFQLELSEPERPLNSDSPAPVVFSTSCG